MLSILVTLHSAIGNTENRVSLET